MSIQKENLRKEFYIIFVPQMFVEGASIVLVFSLANSLYQILEAL